MNAVLSKLKLKEQNPILVINAPEEYLEILKDFTGEVHNEVKGKYSFVQVFAYSFDEMKAWAEKAIEALDGDGYLWMCYPKSSSKKYKTDCKRERVIEAFGPYNFEGVTLVAINDDWSALRVRHVDNIKTMNRKTAMSEKGKERIKDNTENK